MKTNPVPAEAVADLDRWLGAGTWDATQIAGDASAREYFRVLSTDGASRVLTYYPASVRARIGPFLAAYEALHELVPIPSVLEKGEGTVLQEDIGDVSLSSTLERSREQALPLYRQSAELLTRLEEASEQARGINPPFDQEKFLEELDMARRYYVEELAGVDSRNLEGMFSHLADRLTKHPYTLCHRDYHGQNILLYNNQLYLIDYQDLRMGPDMYDLASLLRDRGVGILLGDGFEAPRIEERAEAIGSSVEAARVRYLEALLQRSIKAIGTFARLVVVKGRLQYLAYIGPTLETVRECARELDEWQDLTYLFPFEFKHPGAS